MKSVIDTCIRIGCLHYIYWDNVVFPRTLHERRILRAPGRRKLIHYFGISGLTKGQFHYGNQGILIMLRIGYHD